MFQPVAELRVPIQLDKERILYFNANSMVAYEQQTGKFFLSTVSELFQAVYPDGPPDDNPTGADKTSTTTPLDIVKRVSMTDLRALLWSALHEYDAKDEPFWPLTIGQVGRLFQLKDIIPIFTAFLRGQTGNSPSKEEMGESPAEVSKNPGANGSPPTPVPVGGERGIALPADAFG
jgi:hypothetical protein